MNPRNVHTSTEETRSFEHYRLRFFFFFFFFRVSKHSQGALIEIRVSLALRGSFLSRNRDSGRATSRVAVSVSSRLSWVDFTEARRGHLHVPACHPYFRSIPPSPRSVPPRVNASSLSPSPSFVSFCGSFSSSRTTTFQAMRAAADASSWLEIVICARSVNFY